MTRALQGAIAGIVVRGRRVGGIERALRFLALCPPFAIWMLIRWIRLRRGDAAVVVGTTVRGSRMNLSQVDLIQMFIDLFGVWEPDLWTFITRSLRPGDVFIDVGANVGAFSLLAADVVGDAGKVIAIEASPRIASALRANIDLNPPLARRIDVVEAAVADSPGTLTIHSGPAKNLGKTTLLVERGEGAEAVVRADALPALVDHRWIRSARLIKIDVEGAERAVLAGLQPCLPWLHPDAEVVVECSPDWWRDGERDLGRVLAPWLAAGFHAYEVPNNYWPWRYLWPDDVARPRRIRTPLSGVQRRIDVVLSRRDSEEL